MMETPITRRPSRAARPRYEATETLVYPATQEEAEARKAGNRDHAWVKANPGDPVPDWLIEMSPGQLSKGRVKEIENDPLPPQTWPDLNLPSAREEV